MNAAGNPLLKLDYDKLLAGVRGVGDMQVARQSTAPQTKQTKDDGSPYSQVDLDSDHKVRKVLGSVSSYAIVSEEAPDDANLAAIKSPGPVWVVDPLDGTKQYLKGTPHYSIGISLLSAPDQQGNRHPIFGLNYMPATHDIYYTGQHGTSLHSKLSASGRGDQLFENTPVQLVAANVPVAAKSKPASLRVGVSLRGEGEGFFDTVAQQVQHDRTAHYSMKVAGGSLDAAVCTHPCKIWDVAVLDAILRGAGGAMVPIDLQQKTVQASGFYYGADAARYPGGEMFGVSPYISTAGDLLPHLSYAQGVTPPAVSVPRKG